MQIQTNKLNMTFGDHCVLNNIDIDLDGVRSLVIIGPSGGGKTTLLRIMAGLQMPSDGFMKINDHELQFTEEELRKYRRSIGMVFQAYNLFPHLTALQNVTLPLIQVHGLQKKEAVDRASSLLARFQLEEHGHKKPSQLSGGQKQRIAISRAVAINPEILLLDEPTSALDPEFTAEVLDLINELCSEGMELIMVTHAMGFARNVADHILFLADGEIIESNTPGAVFSQSANPIVKQFFDRVLKY